MLNTEVYRADVPLRLAIISTPRTGNNWLQHLLSRAYSLPRLSPVNLPNVRWAELPRECVMILHWRRDPELLRFLHAHQFQVVTLARHPLDVLISILHFTLRETTDGWLQREAGTEQAILGLTPRSPGFLDYACGPRARALLDVTCDWWRDPACRKVRYEDLVRAPAAEMQRLVEALGVPSRHSLDEAIAATTLTGLRGQFPDRKYHFWQGRPDLWRELLTADEVQPIVAAQADCFRTLAYGGDADPTLTSVEADARWHNLLGLAPGDDAVVRTLQSALYEVKRDLERTRNRLADLEAMGPAALNTARRLKQWVVRFPRLAEMAKRILGKKTDVV